MQKSAGPADSTRGPLGGDIASLPLDRLILAAVALGGLALVAADMFQRWISPTHIWALDIDGRFNAVTWFHSFVLGGAALAALGLALTYGDQLKRLRWGAIGAALAFLSFDKSVSLHERVGQNIEERFNLGDEAGRVIWEVIYLPFLLTFALLLVYAVRRAGSSTRLWIDLALLFCAAKVFLEGIMFPSIEAGLFTEQSVIYGIEANVEETVQLLGFGLFFAALAQLLCDRIVLLARDELEESDAAAEDHPIVDVPLLASGWRRTV